MASLLLNNASHEGSCLIDGLTVVRTPLNAIINYLEIALEGHLDQDTREHLVKSYAASKSLIYVINDLLDLTLRKPETIFFATRPSTLLQP